MDKRYYAFGKTKKHCSTSTTESGARHEFLAEFGYDAVSVQYETASGELIEIWHASEEKA